MHSGSNYMYMYIAISLFYFAIKCMEANDLGQVQQISVELCSTSKCAVQENFRLYASD